MQDISNKTILLLVILTITLSLFSTVLLLTLDVSDFDGSESQEISQTVNKGTSSGRIVFSIIEDSDYPEDSNLDNDLNS